MKLREYQLRLIEQTVEILWTKRVAYLTLETRVGKTPVSLVSAERYFARHHDQIREVLFCTKKGIIPAIEKTAKELRDSGLFTADLTVMSFDSLHHVSWKSGRILIIDEAHSFGSYPQPSKRATQLRALTELVPVILLSATPTPESYSQIFHQLWACHCDIFMKYKSFYHWANVFVDIREKKINKFDYVKDFSKAKWELIKPLLDQITISYTQEEAGFNHTEVTITTIPCPMPPYLRDLIQPFRRVVRKGEDAVPEKITVEFDGKKISADSPAARMSKVHQLCSGTVINDDGEGMIVSTHKIPMLDKILHSYGKIAIYYKFVAELELLTTFYGDRLTSDAHRFEESNGLIYVGQFQSKREGIDLKSAKAIVFYNIDHAYLSYEQTKNRMQSIDRATPPELVLLMSEKGIEEKIFKVVSKKKNYTAAHYLRQECLF
ncbi:MAG TPA: DEAD/DEAH box helicase family protein [Candidatus Cloacimonadota bacterium]|nr:DEAD/DEAH box helicase family protein [Candidatus Cloacimonadota bacterium]HPS38363.1 DEAD/DEAH box helicase family protein [Candidatus Cloacimonadota bacterium]